MSKDAPRPRPRPRKRKPDPPRQEKPWPNFPLYWHHRGYWAVKRDGRQVGYGSDWQAAYDAFRRDEEARRKGESPPARQVLGYTIRDAVNAFYTRQKARHEAGEINARTLLRYRQKLEEATAAVGAATKLYAFASPGAGSLFAKIRIAAMRQGLYQGRDGIAAVRACLDYAHRQKMMPAPEYGEDFDKPSAVQLRRDRQKRAAEHGERAWTVDQLKAILRDARENKRSHLWAFVLLGLNAGFGAGDIAALPLSAVDWQNKLVRFPRPKTAVERVCPLWDETLAALDAAVEDRPEPADPADRLLVFLTRHGRRYVHADVEADEKGGRRLVRVDAVNAAFKRCLKRVGAARKGMGFYSLRAAMRTLALGAGSDPALVEIILGHAPTTQANAAYIRGDVTEKLRGVVNHVYAQLFPLD